MISRRALDFLASGKRGLRMKLIRPGTHTQWFILALGLAIAVGLASLSAFSTASSAQNAATANTAASAPELRCTSTPVRKNVPPLASDPLKGQFDPFEGQLAGSSLPARLLPIDDATRQSILLSGLPCQESASPNGQEKEGLENLQRGFDFYSWRIFIALNSPADGTTPVEKAEPDTPTLWEDMGSFKQLLDVMLPPDQVAASWPTDRPGMEAERDRLMPPACQAVIDAHKEMSGRMVVKMIEESFNEPFKTGPLIDQDGRYAIFDILMNGRMFDYIKNNHLNTKAGQISNSSLAVDFPVGLNSTPKTPNSDIGAFMLKVSWKILSDKEIADQNFHMVKALVLTPPIPNTTRKCLPETLGLIGFHAVHKTASRPQWIWTSFEHVKNVPDRDEVTDKKFNGPYNFYNKDCKDACPVNATPPKPWEPDPALQLKFRHDDSFKSQIVRETPLTNATKNMNAIFQRMLKGTVWENYMLISTQWPSNFPCTQQHLAGTPNPNPDFTKPGTDFTKQPDMTCSPAPTFMANSTLETYSQGDVPLASSSCIACHENAVSFQQGASANPQPGKPKLNQSDFTFILEKAQ
jgi:hypothetical protein